MDNKDNIDVFDIVVKPPFKSKKLHYSHEYTISLIKKAIDDTFNQVHYSHLHPEITPPIEHNKWREDWIKENIKGSLKGSVTVTMGNDPDEMK